MTFKRILFVSLFAAACGGSPMARGVVLNSTPVASFAHDIPSGSGWIPGSAWHEDTPENQGVSSIHLAEGMERVRALGLPVHEILVIRRGTVILDAAFYPFDRDSLHDIASITKSVSSMIAGIALRRDLLRPETDVTRLLGGSGDAVTVEQLLGMRSGFECGFGRGEVELEEMKRSRDWVRFSLDMPRRSAPGTDFGYCSPNYHLISAAIGKATGESEARFARRHLFDPLSIGRMNWPADPIGVSHGWGDLQLAARDLARIGLLMLHDGIWDGTRLLPEGWVERTTTPRVRHGSNNLYGLGWWRHTDSPSGLFEAMGRGGQRLTIWPEKQLVVVILGGGFDPGVVAPFLVSALIADSAIAPNPEGVARLRRAIGAVAAPPALEPFSNAPMAHRGTNRYAISQNDLGLLEMGLTFEDSSASAILKLRDRQLTLPIGLHGRYLIAPDPIDGIHPGARGRWTDDTTFKLELDLIGKIDHYTLTFRFRDRDHATIELVERTGLMRQVLRANAVQ